MHGNCIRVLCPLTIADAELDEALDVWERHAGGCRRARVASCAGRDEDESDRERALVARCTKRGSAMIAGIADEIDLAVG